jgi:hypothetical protein
MNIKPFQTIDGQTLINTPMAAPGFVVSSLIPTGLHILGGSPKIGKSWLMLWLCLCVSKGERFWNYECRQGTALYLCLEDSFERIQSRLLDVTDDAPSCLHFSIMADSLDDGLAKQIEAFLSEHPDTNLIVIDTLQNIRKETNNANPYANDYRELNVLRELANRYHIAILCVHHLRKMKDVDPMNMLSGTTGLSGVVDTVFILDREKRTDGRATLFCTGRDIESMELKLELDNETHIWKLRGESEEVPLLDDTISVVCQHLFSLSDNFSGTATQLAEDIERSTGRSITPAVLRKKLMKHHSELTEHGFDCTFRRTRNEKIIEIKRRDTAASSSELPYT